MKKYFYLIITVLITLSSCKKEETDTTAYTALSVYNASPTFSTYDFYLGDTKLNSVALPFGGGFAYTQRLAGDYSVKYTTAGQIESVLTRTIGLSQNNYFSYFLLGKPGSFDAVLFNDDLSATSTTHAYVRFINLSPDAPAMDLASKISTATTSTSFTTKTAYKSATAYLPLVAGKYTFELKDNATAALKASLTDVTLVANGHYTIICKGFVAPASALELPISAQVIINR